MVKRRIKRTKKGKTKKGIKASASPASRKKLNAALHALERAMRNANKAYLQYLRSFRK